MIYQFLPDVNLRLRDVWVGALVTAGLFNVGKFLIGLYLAPAAWRRHMGPRARWWCC
jgi:membrane protein